MARGEKKDGNPVASQNLPRFVDVQLSADDKREFVDWVWSPESLVAALQRLCDAGYRVGASWSGENQTYSVSLTCRNVDDVNVGLCMTSFARTLDKALALAVWKHVVFTGGNWLGVVDRVGGDFG